LALPIRTPFASVLISISFPGIARHIFFLLYRRRDHLADRHSVTDQNSITLCRIRQEPERDFSDRTMNLILPTSTPSSGTTSTISP
jgi:hypothetical protein